MRGHEATSGRGARLARNTIRAERVHNARMRRTSKQRRAPRRLRASASRHRFADGDVLVQVAKSTAHVGRRQRGTLRSLGLARPGTACLRRASGALARDLRHVAHVLVVEPLTISAMQTIFRDEAEAIQESTVIREFPYEVSGHPACRFELGAAGFLSVETYDPFSTLTWSSALPLATALAAVETILDRPTGDALLYEPAFGKSLQRAEDAFGKLREGATDVPFVRLAFRRLDLVWERSDYPDHIHDTIVTGTVGVITPSFDAHIIEQLITATGTPALGARARELIRRAGRMIATAARP